MKDKLLGTLGICRRAGKLVMGHDAVADAARDGALALILLSRDLSARSGRDMTFIASKHSIECLTAPIHMEEIMRRIGKRSGILGVADRGLADTIKTYLNRRTNEEETNL